MTDSLTMAEWRKLLAPYARANNWRAAFQVVTTGSMLIVAWGVMLWSLDSWPYWVTLLMAIPTAGLQTRMFMFQHDCGHGSFFSSRVMNNRLGGIIGVLTLMPFMWWKKTHSVHHSHSGKLEGPYIGGIRVLTIDKYISLGFLGRIGYRLYRNVLFLMTVGSVWQFWLYHRLPLNTPKGHRWRKAWRSVLWTNVAIVAVLVTASITIGLDSFLRVQIPIAFLSGAFGILLFYLQHNFEDTFWADPDSWTYPASAIRGSSYLKLPWPLNWFTAHIGVHHVHHLSPGIPNHLLLRCFLEVEKLHKVTELKLRDIVKCVRLHLWYRQEERLVSFSEGHAISRAQKLHGHT